MVSLSASSISAVQYLLAPATLPKSLVVPPSPSPPPPSATSESAAAAAAAAAYKYDDDDYDQPLFCLSVLSYNILLPNSVDGWWNYKMYLPPLTDRSMAEWPYRRNLLQQRINLIDADVVCLQEVAPMSFEDDFDFMKALGYDEHEMFKKGRFRPATFWKSSRLTLVAPPVHKDRTLLTVFEPVRAVVAVKQNDVNNNDNNNNEDSSKNKQQETKGKGKGQHQKQQQRYWYVLNCHLQAGGQAQRRLRQMIEGIKAVLTAARKFKEKNPEESVRLIVCGDMNGDERSCGAVRYLEHGVVDETFCENGEFVTTSKKVMPLKQPLVDVAVVGRCNHNNNYNNNNGETAAASANVDVAPPPTLVVPELVSLIVKDGTADAANPLLSDNVIERLGRIYKRFATTSRSSSSDGEDDDDDNFVMNRQDAEKWLIVINEKVGRGSEFRQAAREMGWQSPNPEATLEQEKDLITALPEDGIMTFEGFVNVYQKELKQGKFWGIAHDLAVLGEALPTGTGGGAAGVYTARFDRMYCNAAACVPIAVLDTVCTIPCPNEKEPSDHLPIAATFVAK